MEAISEAEALEFLSQAKVAHVAVVHEGAPYVTPLSFVVDEGSLFFRTKPGKRFEAIGANPQVCVEVSSFDEVTGDWTSVLVYGAASEVTDQDKITRVVELLLDKYEAALGPLLGTGGLQPMASFPHVIEVSIEQISGMSSGRGFHFRTRPGRL